MDSEERKEQKQKNTRNQRLKIVIVAVIVIIIAVVFMKLGNKSNEPDWVNVEAEDGKISIENADVDDGEIHYFKLNGADLGFFILKNPDDEIVTRISLCKPCDGRSFHLDDNGKVMVCDVCGTTWDTSEFKGISGGCVDDPPPPLPHSEESGLIIINEEHL